MDKKDQLIGGVLVGIGMLFINLSLFISASSK